MLKSEVRSAQDNYFRNKAAVPNWFLIELVSGVDNHGNDIIEIINEIYKSSNISEEFTRCIFVALRSQEQMNGSSVDKSGE